MKQQKLPAEKYIKRKIETVAVVVRIRKDLVETLEILADKHGTSKNRLYEAALEWYVKELE